MYIYTNKIKNQGPENVASAFERISGRINEVDAIATEVSGTVSQQVAAAEEISHSAAQAAQAAQGTGDVIKNFAQVCEATDKTSEAPQLVSTTVGTLSAIKAATVPIDLSYWFA